MSLGLGLGVMINMLSGYNVDTEALKDSVGKTIYRVKLNNDVLRVVFTDKTCLEFRDCGQSCCERRYMVCDDNLSEFKGAYFQDVEVQDAPNKVGEYGDEHEVQFLRVKTSLGDIVCSNHNEHNGYYGGFSIGVKKA